MPSAQRPTNSRLGYQVGVFKEGKLKKMLPVKDSVHYLRDKQKKWKAKKPKRECSDAQLAALAKGRAARGASLGSKSATKKSAKPVKAKDSHYWNERSVKSTNPKKRKRAIRAKKEQESRKSLNKRGDDARGVSSDSDGGHSSAVSGDEEY